MRQVPLRQLLDYHPVHCTKYHDIVGPTSSTMVAVYDYRRPSKTPWTPNHLRDMNNYYHCCRREPLLPLRHVYDYFPRRHVNNYFLYDRYENVYFLYIVPNAFRPECTLRRYNPEMTDRVRMRVL